jgi:hypothetical protein
VPAGVALSEAARGRAKLVAPFSIILYQKKLSGQPNNFFEK